MKAPNITPEDVADMRRMRAEGKTGKEIAEWIGCCPQTVYRYLAGWPIPKVEYDWAQYSRLRREKIKQNPELLAAYNAGCRVRQKRYRDRLKLRNLKEAAE